MESFQGYPRLSFLFPALFFVFAFGGIVRARGGDVRLARGPKDATNSQKFPARNPGHL